MLHLYNGLLLLFYDLHVASRLLFVFYDGRLKLFAVIFLKLELLFEHPKLIRQVRDNFVISYDLLIVIADLCLDFSEAFVALFALGARRYGLRLSYCRQCGVSSHIY